MLRPACNAEEPDVEPHSHFDLRLHDDDELANLLGAAILTRESLHAWPLSSVEEIRLADERVYVYKAQRAPTVEPAFYAAMAAVAPEATVSTQVLVGAETLWEEPPYACLLLEHVDAPRLDAVARQQHVGMAICALIHRAVGELPQAVPVYRDLGSPEQWSVFTDELVDLLRRSVVEEAFVQVQSRQIDALAAYLAAQPEFAAACTGTRLVHGDLTAENVFVTANGVRIVDWQRPLIGPPALDMATLLASVGIDPVPHVGATIVHMVRLLHIHWFAECALHWFPAGRKTYEAQTIALLNAVLHEP